jgi:hypothetical protein
MEDATLNIIKKNKNNLILVNVQVYILIFLTLT